MGVQIGFEILLYRGKQMFDHIDISLCPWGQILKRGFFSLIGECNAGRRDSRFSRDLLDRVGITNNNYFYGQQNYTLRLLALDSRW